MTENQETGLGQGEQGILDLCISGHTSEGAHAKMRSNAGQDEPQKVAMEARESLAYLKPEKAYTPIKIKDILEADDVEIGPRKRDLAELIRAAYPKALNKQIYKAGDGKGKRQRRWIGVGATPEPPAGTEPPDEIPETTINKRNHEASDSGNQWEGRLEASDWQPHLNDLEPIVYVLDCSEQGWHRFGDLRNIRYPIPPPNKPTA